MYQYNHKALKCFLLSDLTCFCEYIFFACVQHAHCFCSQMLVSGCVVKYPIYPIMFVLLLNLLTLQTFLNKDREDKENNSVHRGYYICLGTLRYVMQLIHFACTNKRSFDLILTINTCISQDFEFDHHFSVQ